MCFTIIYLMLFLITIVVNVCYLFRFYWLFKVSNKGECTILAVMQIFYAVDWLTRHIWYEIWCMWCFELISDGFTVGMLFNIVVNDEWTNIDVNNFYIYFSKGGLFYKQESLIDMFPEWFMVMYLSQVINYLQLNENEKKDVR